MRAAGRRLILLALAASPASFAALGLSAKPLIEFIAPKMTIADIKPSKCQTVSDAASMIKLPKGRVMAPIDLGPAIFDRPRRFCRALSSQQRRQCRDAQADAGAGHRRRAKCWQIVASTMSNALGSSGPGFLSTRAGGISRAVGGGEIPDFLEPLDLDPTHTISVWRVRRLTCYENFYRRRRLVFTIAGPLYRSIDERSHTRRLDDCTGLVYGYCAQ